MAIEEHRTRTPAGERRHRVHQFAGRAHEVLDDILGRDGSAFVAVAELSVSATRESIVEIARLQDRLEALKGKLLDHGDILAIGTAPDDTDSAPDSKGARPAIPATTTPGWYAAALTKDRRTATQIVKRAKRLEDAFHATGRALAAGTIDADQALVIIEAVDALPDFVLDFERRRAERHLLTEAGHYDASVLKRLGRHLLEVIDPEGLDEYLAKKLADEEARAARKTYFHLRRDGNGAVKGEFVVPELQAAMLQTSLNAIASPKRPDALAREHDDENGEKAQLTTPELLGLAFCEYIERFPADELPVAGGINATVVVTMELETLLGGIKPAQLDTGESITAGQARRLASQCGVIPAVLGTGSEVLDLGRTVRLHNAKQRTALRLRHRTCTVEGCTVPSAWCHAHHKKPWSRGGRTSLKNGTLLCPAHHRLVHRPGYEASHDGDLTRITQTTRRRQ